MESAGTVWVSEAKPALDVYLLRVLATLLAEGSVTRTAVRLDQSQPAISAALRRLREITGDPLLVRGKSGLVATARGAALLEPARTALREIARIEAQPAAFDPATSTRPLRIGSPDYLNALFLPTVVMLVRAQAPAATLEWQSLGPRFDYERALEGGALDVVIGNWPEPPEPLHRRELFADRMVCLMSSRHPLAGRRMTQEEYLAAAHLAPTPYSPTQRGLVDLHLSRLRLKRQVAVTIPYFTLAPYVLAQSDLLFTTTAFFAEHYAERLALTVAELPIAFPSMHYYQLMHERAAREAEVLWLAELIAQATRLLLARRVPDPAPE